MWEIKLHPPHLTALNVIPKVASIVYHSQALPSKSMTDGSRFTGQSDATAQTCEAWRGPSEHAESAKATSYRRLSRLRPADCVLPLRWAAQSTPAAHTGVVPMALFLTVSRRALLPSWRSAIPAMLPCCCCCSEALLLWCIFREVCSGLLLQGPSMRLRSALPLAGGRCSTKGNQSVRELSAFRASALQADCAWGPLPLLWRPSSSLQMLPGKGPEPAGLARAPEAALGLPLTEGFPRGLRLGALLAAWPPASADALCLGLGSGLGAAKGFLYCSLLLGAALPAGCEASVAAAT